MNIPCFILFVFCMGVLTGQSGENPIMNLVTILALVGTFSPLFVDFYEEITRNPYEEDEEDEQDINKHYYNKPYKPF